VKVFDSNSTIFSSNCTGTTLIIQLKVYIYESEHYKVNLTILYIKNTRDKKNVHTVLLRTKPLVTEINFLHPIILGHI